jgi:hypothetical protein
MLTCSASIPFFPSEQRRTTPTVIVKKIARALSSAKWKEFGIELLVVVVGVFLAIQVDNWNDRRNELHMEKALLESLYSDFETNQQIAELRVEQYAKAAEAALKLLEASATDQSQSSSDIYSLIEQAVFIRPPEFNSNTWDLLSASGQLTVIKSEDIKKQISDFYRTTSAYSRGLQEQVSEKSEALEQYIENHLDVVRYIHQVHPDDLSFLEFENDDAVALDDPSRRELKNLSVQTWHIARDYRGNMTRTLEIRQDIEDSLTEELKRFD